MSLLRRSRGVGLWRVTVAFLLVTTPIETMYSWRGGLLDPYYLVKVAGWILLTWGSVRFRNPHLPGGTSLLAAGWGWMAANFWRAVADRLARVAVGQDLRLGSVELWFAEGCLVVSLIALAWSLVAAARER